MPNPSDVKALRTFQPSERSLAEAYRDGLQVALNEAPYGCSYPEPTLVRFEQDILSQEFSVYFQIGYWNDNGEDCFR